MPMRADSAVLQVLRHPVAQHDQQSQSFHAGHVCRGPDPSAFVPGAPAVFLLNPIFYLCSSYVVTDVHREHKIQHF